MKLGMFRTPVRILVGLGYPSEVKSVIEAYRLLDNWPALGRDAAHSVALKACRAALNGEIEPDIVRDCSQPSRSVITCSSPIRNSSRLSAADETVGLIFGNSIGILKRDAYSI